MNSQPKWDIYESVVLLNGYLLACKKSEPRAYIIRRVSADLRAMAIHRGRKIDEIFRNENGISYQMQSMDSAYKGRKIYVPATKLFQETVSLYRNQNGRFQELLKEARYMIEHDIAHPAPNDTDVFVVDFNDCPDMSFARVNSLTYRGQAILIRPKWRDLYIALLKKLYADYSNEIDSVVGKVYGRASAPFVGNCHSISLMRSPGEFAPDRYVELNISATTVIVNIKTMLDICGTSYEDVNITYTKGNKDQMEELLKVQNIRTVFSAELLSIAGPLNDGGAQEFGMRAGTENVASIVGMAKALEISCSTLNENAEHVLKLEHALLERLKESGLDFVRNGARNHIPGNISVSFKDADGEAILHRLDLMGICVSTGSACDSVSTQISHVLKAIKLEDNYARGTIRISFGKENTFEEADIIAESLIRILKK